MECGFYFENNLNVGQRRARKEVFDLPLIFIRVFVNAIIKVENHIFDAPTRQVFVERQKLSCRCADG